MNSGDSNRWKSEVLDLVLAAFAEHPPLRDILIFKGARILNLRLGEESRQSLDIDSNLDLAFAEKHAESAERQDYLQRECELALRRFFQRQKPIRYATESVQVELQPDNGRHPWGWDGLGVKIRLKDFKYPQVRGLPAMERDVASPEKLGACAVSELRVNSHTVRAYSLERIAGEKMRAFLSSLPAYIAKIGRRTDTRRVKDLYDLARIRRQRPISDAAFWLTVGTEFRLACESRSIDCAGIATFAEELPETRLLYEKDPTLPRDIAFDEAWETLLQAVAFFEKERLIPFQFPLPPRK